MKLNVLQVPCISTCQTLTMDLLALGLDPEFFILLYWKKTSKISSQSQDWWDMRLVLIEKIIRTRKVSAYLSCTRVLTAKSKSKRTPHLGGRIISWHARRDPPVSDPAPCDRTQVRSRRGRAGRSLFSSSNFLDLVEYEYYSRKKRPWKATRGRLDRRHL